MQGPEGTASLADQASDTSLPRVHAMATTVSTAIALGANCPGPAGPPLATLLQVRPQLEGLLQQLGYGTPQWSPLFRTSPVGGPAGQPDFLNAVVLAHQQADVQAHDLLLALQQQEAHFGRQRREHWGPRSLDLDLLWCGGVAIQTAALTLPHPRLQQRRVVLAPLACLAPSLVPPGSCCSIAALLQQLPLLEDEAVTPLPGRPGWPE